MTDRYISSSCYLPFCNKYLIVCMRVYVCLRRKCMDNLKYLRIYIYLSISNSDVYNLSLVTELLKNHTQN